MLVAWTVVTGQGPRPVIFGLAAKISAETGLFVSIGVHWWFPFFAKTLPGRTRQGVEVEDLAEEIACGPDKYYVHKITRLMKSERDLGYIG